MSARADDLGLDACRMPEAGCEWCRWSSVPSSCLAALESASLVSRRCSGFGDFPLCCNRPPTCSLPLELASTDGTSPIPLPSSHPGTSLHPSSPRPMVSSPKPLPIHSAPLNPIGGSEGPKAAGRARKNVELSSVRLIMAEGGKSEPGDVKENRAFNLLL